MSTPEQDKLLAETIECYEAMGGEEQTVVWLKELQRHRTNTAVMAMPDFEYWWSHVRRGFTVVNADVQRELQMEAWNACYSYVQLSTLNLEDYRGTAVISDK